MDTVIWRALNLHGFVEIRGSVLYFNTRKLSVYDSALLLVICFSSLISAADYDTKEAIKVSRSCLIVSVWFLTSEFRLRDEEPRGATG